MSTMLIFDKLEVFIVIVRITFISNQTLKKLLQGVNEFRSSSEFGPNFKFVQNYFDY